MMCRRYLSEQLGASQAHVRKTMAIGANSLAALRAQIKAEEEEEEEDEAGGMHALFPLFISKFSILFLRLPLLVLDASLRARWDMHMIYNTLKPQIRRSVSSFFPQLITYH